MTRRAQLLFALTVGMSVTLAWVLLGVEAVSGAAGLPHPDHAMMRRGGPGLERLKAVLLPGWLLGSFAVAFFATCFALGARALDRLTIILISASAVFYELVWTILVVLSWRFASVQSTALFLSFPAPTAWLLFVFTPAPLVFLVLYLLRFESFMPPDSELDRLRRLRQSEEGESIG
ncbi:MAG: hypothetical protein JRJ58_00940 [Deltaproteobacteria bacterium]|nr:hypothetical protein [Deltaproteobacteria bacterium]